MSVPESVDGSIPVSAGQTSHGQQWKSWNVFYEPLCVPDSPPAAVVAMLRHLIGHDCLSVYLFHSGLTMTATTWMTWSVSLGRIEELIA
ncbi:hypothetical protein CEXT_456111 [Caerostris extrusa]|uniref:Uncharacterized protein n=1 Tax=Caerostris extrusa TaxID=172846 RepID=A0AAV4RVW9_CAEEX|nr:hypothetical protein CEXT_456111 [Caerostris extrusa]